VFEALPFGDETVRRIARLNPFIDLLAQRWTWSVFVCAGARLQRVLALLGGIMHQGSDLWFAKTLGPAMGRSRQSRIYIAYH
jgi:hypothetical protein